MLRIKKGQIRYDTEQATFEQLENVNLDWFLISRENNAPKMTRKIFKI